MHQIDWYGNDGRANYEPGIVKTVDCGVCNIQINVERNILGPTSFAEAMAGRSRRYDRFTCIHVKENWHKRIYRLKIDVYLAEIDGEDNRNEIKKAAEEEIIKLLEVNAVR